MPPSNDQINAIRAHLQGLDIRMTEVEQGDHWREGLSRSMEDIRDDVRQLREALLGDGKAVIGIITRLDRVEQVQDARKWQMRAVIGGFIAVVCKWVWDFIVANGKNLKP